MKNFETNIKRISMKIDYHKLIFTFLVTVIIGLIAHAYCYLNLNLSHDSLACLISTGGGGSYYQNGRFLRPIYQIIKCYWELPWLNGLLSITYFSLAMYFVNDALGIDKKNHIIISCGLLVTCSSISLLNATYLHDADSYILAFLFTSLGLWISRNFNRGRIISIPFFIVSLGLYQAYIQVAIIVYIILFVFDVLDGNDLKNSLLKLMLDAITIILSMVAYYAICSLLLSINNIEKVGEYNSVSLVTSSFISTLLDKIYNTLVFDAAWFIYPNANKPTLILVFNILLSIAALFSMILIIKKKRIKALNIVTLCFILLLTPFAINAITLISGISHALTFFSLYFCYIFAFLLIRTANTLFDFSSIKKIYSLCIILLSLMIVDNCIFSNRLYLQKELVSQNTLSTMTRIIDRIEQVEGYEVGKTEVALIGQLEWSNLANKRDFIIDYNLATGMDYYFSPTYYGGFATYFQTYLGYPINLLSEKESKRFKDYKEVKSMKSFPYSDSCKIIDGVLVIKLSD